MNIPFFEGCAEKHTLLILKSQRVKKKSFFERMLIVASGHTLTFRLRPLTLENTSRFRFEDDSSFFPTSYLAGVKC